MNTCPKRVIYHLAALNDQFKSVLSKGLNRSETLVQFSAQAKLDETASLEGDAGRKADFTFSFAKDDQTVLNVCCEPHLKLCHTDGYPGDSSYSNERRIYFHEGINDLEKGRILIGHIGKHL